MTSNAADSSSSSSSEQIHAPAVSTLSTSTSSVSSLSPASSTPLSTPMTTPRDNNERCMSPDEVEQLRQINSTIEIFSVNILSLLSNSMKQLSFDDITEKYTAKIRLKSIASLRDAAEHKTLVRKAQAVLEALLNLVDGIITLELDKFVVREKEKRDNAVTAHEFFYEELLQRHTAVADEVRRASVGESLAEAKLEDMTRKRSPRLSDAVTTSSALAWLVEKRRTQLELQNAINDAQREMPHVYTESEEDYKRAVKNEKREVKTRRLFFKTICGQVDCSLREIFCMLENLEEVKDSPAAAI